MDKYNCKICMDLGCDECGQEFKTCLDHYINPEMLLPDRSGDYEVRLDGKNESDIRFRARRCELLP
jgi:hypothetical protein